MRGEKRVDGFYVGEKSGEIATTFLDKIVTILYGFDPVILKLCINIFPWNIFEKLGRGRGGGDDVGSKQVGDCRVSQVSLPVTPIVVTHDGVSLGVVDHGVKLVATTGINFGSVECNLDTTISNTSQRLINLDDGG